MKLANQLVALCFLAIAWGPTLAFGQTTITRFRAEMDESYVILGGVQGTGSNAGGYAEFTLTQSPTETTMSYFIQFENVDLDGTQTPDPLDNISALHLHDITQCAPNFPQCIPGTDTAGTIHVLNIFGLPRNDDDDVVVDPVAGTISGLWDDGDASPPGTMAPSLPISDPDVLARLFNQEIALFVHTNAIPTAAAGGALMIVPEPTSAALGMVLLPMLLLARRRFI